MGPFAADIHADWASRHVLRLTALPLPRTKIASPVAIMKPDSMIATGLAIFVRSPAVAGRR